MKLSSDVVIGLEMTGGIISFNRVIDVRTAYQMNARDEAFSNDSLVRWGWHRKEWVLPDLNNIEESFARQKCSKPGLLVFTCIGDSFIRLCRLTHNVAAGQVRKMQIGPEELPGSCQCGRLISQTCNYFRPNNSQLFLSMISSCTLRLQVQRLKNASGTANQSSPRGVLGPDPKGSPVVVSISERAHSER